VVRGASQTPPARVSAGAVSPALRYDLDGRLVGVGIDSLHYNAAGLIDSTLGALAMLPLPFGEAAKL